MRVALYGKETAERHSHGKSDGFSQAERSVRERCRSARPDPRVHVNDPASASREASYRTCRMGLTWSRRQGVAT